MAKVKESCTFAGMSPKEGAVNYEYIHIISSSRLRIPTVYIQCSDISHWFSTAKVLGDGVPIVVTYKSETSSKSLTFIYTAHKSKKVGPNQTLYYIEAILNVPRYWFDGTPEPGYFKGTANDCINYLAKYSGLKYFGTPTNDVQTWWLKGKNVAKAIFEVADSAYINDTSCMKVVCDIANNGTLLLRNLEKIPSAQYTMRHNGTDAKTEIPFTGSIEPKSMPGAKNSTFAYNKVMISSTPNSSEVKKQGDDYIFYSHSKISPVKTESGNINVSGAVSSKATQTQIIAGPIDIGNNHDKFARAIYQNSRGLSLYSVCIEVTTSSITDLFLTASVNVISESDTQWSGLWFVSSRAIIITDGLYREKLELTRRTVSAPTATSTIAANQSVVSPSAQTLSQVQKPTTKSSKTFNGSDILAVGSSLVDQIGSGVSSALNIVSGITSSVASTASSLASSVTNSVSSIASSALSSVSSLPIDDPTRIAAIAQAKLDIAASVASNATALASSSLQASYTNAKNAAVLAMDSFKVQTNATNVKVLSQAKDTATAALSGLSAKPSVSSALSNATNSYSATAASAVSSIPTSLPTVPDPKALATSASNAAMASLDTP